MKKVLLFGLLLSVLCGCNNSTANNSDANNNPDPKAPVASLMAGADSTTVRYCDAIPEGCKEEDSFGLILDYGGYSMIVSTNQMPNGDWVIYDHWCEEEDSGTYVKVDADGKEVEMEYKDPFEGHPYAIIHNPKLSFSTRNYGGETINFFAAADSQEVSCTTNYKEITLHVLGSDPKTRRVMVQSVSTDWCWGEAKDKEEAEFRHPFVELKGWIDEEWVCANTVSTCP